MHLGGMSRFFNNDFGAYGLAFIAGCVLTLMVLFNGQLAAGGTALFSSWAAHGTGTVAALIFLGIIVLRRKGLPRASKTRAPLWAYFGGLSGALTVVLTSTTVNSALALSGTLALGLAGQMIFSLGADRWGLFGLPKRKPGAREMAAIALIAAGSLIIIFYGQG
jgi:transporter family-2 protein